MSKWTHEIALKPRERSPQTPRSRHVTKSHPNPRYPPVLEPHRARKLAAKNSDLSVMFPTTPCGVLLRSLPPATSSSPCPHTLERGSTAKHSLTRRNISISISPFPPLGASVIARLPSPPGLPLALSSCRREGGAGGEQNKHVAVKEVCVGLYELRRFVVGRMTDTR